MNKFQSVEAYIQSFEGIRKDYLQQLRELIHEAAPCLTESVIYNVAGFILVEGGKMEESIMIAAFKNHVGFYPHPSTMEHFWDRLDGYKKAKGSLQFPLDKPLPKALIKDMVKYRLSLLEE